MDLLRSQSAEEHHLHFRCHEKEVPARGVDLALKGEAIQGRDRAPVPCVGLIFQSQEFGHPRPLLHQNRADLNCWRHASS